jgi:hypothetical protein
MTYKARIKKTNLGDLRIGTPLGNERIVEGYEGVRDVGDYEILNKKRREEERREVLGVAKKLPKNKGGNKRGPNLSKKIRDALEKRSKK